MKFNFLTVLFSIIAISSLQTVVAQAKAEDNVTLNVKLSPIQTLTINDDSRIVNLEYKTKEDYADGVSVVKADHIKIYSTGGFEIKVKSDGPLVGTDDNINVSDIKITATKGTTNSLDPKFFDETALTVGQGATILTSGVGGVDQTFNVKYAAAGDNKYLNLYKGENPTVFTATVTYTILAQ